MSIVQLANGNLDHVGGLESRCKLWPETGSFVVLESVSRRRRDYSLIYLITEYIPM